MRTEEFWVMDERDEGLADDLALGLGAAPARVLAYLLGRGSDDRVDTVPARQIDIRLGTGLGRQSVTDALSTLSARGLVTESTLESDQGRPPKVWSADGPVETATRGAFESRADELVSALSAEAAGSTDAAGTGSIRVGFNWRPNGLHIPFYAALETAAYETAGVDADFTHYRGSKRALDAVVDGDVDVAVVGAATLTGAMERGRTIEPLAVLYQRAMTVLYTTEGAFGGPLTSSEQLRERRIGLSPEHRDPASGRAVPLTGRYRRGCRGVRNRRRGARGAAVGAGRRRRRVVLRPLEARSGPRYRDAHDRRTVPDLRPGAS